MNSMIVDSVEGQHGWSREHNFDMIFGVEDSGRDGVMVMKSAITGISPARVAMRDEGIGAKK